MESEVSTKRKGCYGNILFSVALVFLLIGLAFTSRAQQFDSLKNAIPDSTRIKLRQEFAGKDSVKTSIKDKQDSIRKVSSSVSGKIHNIQNKFLSRADSIEGGGTGTTLRVDLDSLRPGTPRVVAGAQEKLSAIQQRIASKQDSLQGKASHALGNVNDKVNGKLQEKINSSGIDKEALPEAGLGDLQAPAVNSNGIALPDANLPDVKLPGMESPDLPGVGVPSANTNLPAAPNTNVPSSSVNDPLDGGNTLKLGDVNQKLNSGEIGEVGEKIQSVADNASGIQGHVGELKKIKDTGLQEPGKIADQAEDRIGEVSQVQAAQKSLGAVAEKQRAYEAMVAKYKDKKIVMSEMKRKMANIATDQINQSTPQIKEAQTVMDKQKHALVKAKKLKGAVKKKENVLGAKPFGQRVIPGLTIETRHKRDFIVDFAVQAGYRFTERLTAGAGLTYTVGFNKSYDLYTRGLNIYGMRAYGDFLLLNGFFAHGEFVWGHYQNPVATTQELPVYNTSSFNTGIGKRFNLSKRVKGTMMALYRLEIQGHIPHQSKLNVRFGFDLYPKKKRKVQD